MKILEKEFIKFLLVGFFNTLIGLSIIYLLLYININNYISNFTGYMIGLSISYMLHKNFVFSNSSNKINKREIVNYVIIFVVSYSINLAILYIGLNYFINYIAQFFAICGYTISNYLLNKNITFRIIKEKGN
jgi:putative flippase GtrA